MRKLALGILACYTLLAAIALFYIIPAPKFNFQQNRTAQYSYTKKKTRLIPIFVNKTIIFIPVPDDR